MENKHFLSHALHYKIHYLTFVTLVCYVNSSLVNAANGTLIFLVSIYTNLIIRYMLLPWARAQFHWALAH